MTATFRTRARRFLLTVGALAGALAGGIALTGGFVTFVGTTRISARGVTNPLLVAGTAGLLLALLEREQVSKALSALGQLLDRHAVAIALVFAASCMGVGVRFGTFAAHATDPSAYVSHSKLLLTGPLVRVEPLAQAFPAWHGGAWNFSPLGYRPGLGPADVVPTYPMGLPAVMAVARLGFGEVGPYLAVPLLGAALVLGCFALASRLHSRSAGLVAAALAATSPILLFHLVTPMSDVPAATWLVLALLAALGESRLSGMAAGVCLGMLGATRPNLAPLSLAVGLCALGWPLRRWTELRWLRLVPLGAGLAMVMAPFLALQTRLYGSPFATGYGSLDQYFAVSNIVPNVRDYFWRIVHGETVALGLAVGAALLVATRRRKAEGDIGSRPGGVRACAHVALCVGALMLALYLPYGIFPDWAYLRFLLPGLAVAFVFVGALLAESVGRLPRRLQGLALVVVMATAGTLNLRAAAGEQVFNLWRYESRYRSVSLYLKETMPANAVVITFQESGAIRYYTGAPIVRWDYLPNTLEEAVEALRERRLQPLLVVEDWERLNLERRFPRSPLAKLDWTPRADIGETTHVWILDPADRDTNRPIVTDRFR